MATRLHNDERIEQDLRRSRGETEDTEHERRDANIKKERFLGVL